MSKLVWDAIGEHVYETGTEKGVLYPVTAEGTYPAGVAWNGLTGFSESPDGGDATDIWADDIKYLSIRARENFKATITAYTYPDEWAECDGSAEIATGVMIGHKATAHIVIDSTKFTTTTAQEKLAAFEDVLYGSNATVYVVTKDTTKQQGKTYYTRSGSSPNYNYAEFTGGSFVEGTTYYEATTAGPRLPMPDEVISLLS